ncbi:ABC transporter permease [Rhizobium oryzicola]|uniref:ABC transporter permease n=1 Tax=Rhizobium oryzicola TaxID=1232668 RepID=A0ABT8SPR8_9HYPH|nr:ABC transporter permease [Rhizobium oryzicola]MDO1580517.1 ABC transporter permease [Rhizobium oryzicola]
MTFASRAIPRLIGLCLLLGLFLQPQLFEPVFRPLANTSAPSIYAQAELWSLALSHVVLALGATLGALILAVSAAVVVTRSWGASFLPLSRSIANIGQTFPPVAVLALAVPALGFGDRPTFVALLIYGLLPIFETTLTGLTTLPAPVMEAARGSGMTEWQCLRTVELPLALPLIVAGFRLSLVIGLSTAAIGSTVAARTLGEVIIAGLQSNNLAFIVQGGLAVAGLAVLAHDALTALEIWARRRTRLAV